MVRTRVKICCISSPEEAALALVAGADAVGLVGPMPSGAGIIGYERARHIAATVPPPVMPVLLTSQTRAEAIAEQARACEINTVQLVKHVSVDTHDWLARHAPALRRIQVIHVEGMEALEVIAHYGDRPHAFLLDSGRPDTDEYGGTGRRHDWQVSARCVREARRPVFLAGGLDAANAAEAIAAVRPFGLDVCSGLRTDEGLDPTRLAAFMRAVRKADAEASRQVA